MLSRRDPIPAQAGVGLRFRHHQGVLDSPPAAAWFEVHTENYMGGGGPPHRRLEAIRELYPLSLHGVGLSIGSPEPLDRAHLGRLVKVAERYEPAMVSEHLAWSTHDGAFFNDLLPLPYTGEALARATSPRELMKIRFPLSAKILLWFFLNLIFLGLVFYVFVRIQFRLDD